MIPSTGPPFAMTRWVAQTHQNYVSVTPYNWTATRIHGFQATRQPAIWMGESGPVVVIPGVSRDGEAKVEARFDERGLRMRKETEVITPSYYSVVLEDGFGGEVLVEQSSSEYYLSVSLHNITILTFLQASRVGHLRFTFTPSNSETDIPYILLESSRPSILTSTPTNISFPDGTTVIHPFPNTNHHVHEICGSNSERQDSIITPTSTQPHVDNFRGYYCARFDYDRPAQDHNLSLYGIVQNTSSHPGIYVGRGALLSGYVLFPLEGERTTTVTVRIGTSFISIDQARNNIDAEIPDRGPRAEDTRHSPQTLERTARLTRSAWVEKLDRFALEGATEMQREVFWTGVAHALQVTLLLCPGLDFRLGG